MHISLKRRFCRFIDNIRRGIGERIWGSPANRKWREVERQPDDKPNARAPSNLKTHSAFKLLTMPASYKVFCWFHKG